MIVYDVREGMEKLISQYDMQKKFKVEEVLQVEECLNDMKNWMRWRRFFSVVSTAVKEISS